jgi:hypothetical protein
MREWRCDRVKLGRWAESLRKSVGYRLRLPAQATGSGKISYKVLPKSVWSPTPGPPNRTISDQIDLPVENRLSVIGQRDEPHPRRAPSCRPGC